jgi:hypothetical protein
MKLRVTLHQQAGVVMLMDAMKDYNINVRLENSTPGALDGLAITEVPVEINLDEPIIITGITIEGVNE